LVLLASKPREIVPGVWTIALWIQAERVSPSNQGAAVNDRQLEALAYVRERGRITDREYQHIGSFWHSETLCLDLADLARRGLFVKIGCKRARLT